MNKKVYIKQDGTIPGHRIIEELERRGGKVRIQWEFEESDSKFYIREDSIIYIKDEEDMSDYTELLYDKETDTFYEKSQRIISAEAKEALILMQDGYAKADNIETYTIMTEGEYDIPEGYEATIDGGKIIVRKKKWKPKDGDVVWYVSFDTFDSGFKVGFITADENFIPELGDFETREEAIVFCGLLNDAIKDIVEKRKEVEL